MDLWPSFMEDDSTIELFYEFLILFFYILRFLKWLSPSNPLSVLPRF